MTEGQIEILTDSLQRCLDCPDFMDTFYDHFVDSSPAVAEKFATTDMRMQKRVVKKSLLTMIEAVTRRVEDFSFLEDLAERHSRRGADIQPYLYDLWVDSLVRAVRRCDPRCDEKCEAVWRLAMKPGVEYIVSRY